MTKFIEIQDAIILTQRKVEGDRYKKLNDNNRDRFRNSLSQSFKDLWIITKENDRELAAFVV
jgi:hypothetical protein